MQGIDAVRIGLQYSRAGTALIAAGTAVTLVVAYVTPWTPALRLAVMALVVALAADGFGRVAWLQGPRAVRSLRMQRDGAIEVERACGARVAGQVRAGSFVAPWLVIVRWRAHGSRRDSTVLLLPDMADRNDLRRLRVLLRWD